MRTRPNLHVWQGGVQSGVGCGYGLRIEAGVGAHLREATVEAGGPATLGAGSPAAQALAAQDAVAALGVGAPGQVGAALHVATKEGLLVLWGRRCHQVRAWLSRMPHLRPPPWGLPLRGGGGYLGDDLWRGDDGTNEGSCGLGRAVGNGAGAVCHKVLLYSSRQILIPARLGGKEEVLLRDSVGAAQGGGILVTHLAPSPPTQRDRGKSASRSTSKLTLILLASVGFPTLARVTVVFEDVWARVAAQL